jgi:hypothetical protein
MMCGWEMHEETHTQKSILFMTPTRRRRNTGPSGESGFLYNLDSMGRLCLQLDTFSNIAGVIVCVKRSSFFQVEQ